MGTTIKREDRLLRSKRRDFLRVAAIGPVALWVQSSTGQSSRIVPLVAWLNTGSRSTQGKLLVAFKEGMTERGWREGSSYQLQDRWTDGDPNRTEPLANELALKKPTVIVAGLTSAVRAAVKAAPGTPVVQAYGGASLVPALAASLARPGGMVTGLTNISFDTAEKRLEVLLDAVPSIRRVGFLIDTSLSLNATGGTQAAKRSLERHKIDGRLGEIGTPESIEPVISRLAREGVQGLVVMPSLFFGVHITRIVQTAMASQLPVVGGTREHTEAGALLSYGTDVGSIYRRSAYFVDRILRGAKPGDLPIEQPTTIELTVNLRSAQSLGIKLPPSVVMRANGVVQ